MKTTKLSSNKFEVSARNFSLFRFLFGIMMIPQVLHLVPFVHDLGNSTFVFHYPYLSFIEAYSHELIDFIEVTSIAGAVLLALGIFPRVAALVFLLSFGYMFLIDMTFYNNHYYLWCLLSFLFVLTDTQNSISVIDLIKGKTDKTMHVRNYVVFALLISIIYFYAAAVKINPDWLDGEPMRSLMHSRNYPLPDLAGYFLSYGGLLFDGAMAFLLWKKPKAWYVAIPYFGFHTSNYFTFNIGEFPLVMMAAWLIYLTVSKFDVKELIQSAKNHFRLSALYVVYIVFFVFQIIFPLRYLLAMSNGSVAWHRQGYFFSWRMMLNNHDIKFFQYDVSMADRKDGYSVMFDKLITFRQFSNSYHDPYLIWLLAQKLKKDAQRKYKTQNVKVFCKSLISLNNHPDKDLIIPTVDLGAVPYYLHAKNSFINY